MPIGVTITESARPSRRPVPRGGEPHGLTGGAWGDEGSRDRDRGRSPRADRISASGPKGEKTPASYVAGLMGKSGFQTSPERAAYGQSVLEPSRAAGPRGAASPFAEVSPRRAARAQSPGRAGGLRPGLATEGRA